MNLAFVVMLPFLGAVLPPLVERLGANRTWLAIGAALFPATALALLVNPARQVFAGETLHSTLNWIPSLNLSLAFRLDGLALLFALRRLFPVALVIARESDRGNGRRETRRKCTVFTMYIYE